MTRPFQRPVIGKRVRGLMYFKQLKPLFARLHRLGTEHDRAGNRKLFYDQYVGLILLYFFNPDFRSLRALQRASCVAKVRKKLKCSRTSLGSLSEAARVFDANALQAIVGELAQQALPLHRGKDADILRGLTAVDGTLLPALPKRLRAFWREISGSEANPHGLPRIPKDLSRTRERNVHRGIDVNPLIERRKRKNAESVGSRRFLVTRVAGLFTVGLKAPRVSRSSNSI